ncbi:hypothetical protein CY35_13G056400 [Sphagnum magellanicum]|nr:hypothetical protein CY35_13G056400 [Sphagnum magellanicum]
MSIILKCFETPYFSSWNVQKGLGTQFSNTFDGTTFVVEHKRILLPRVSK